MPETSVWKPLLGLRPPEAVQDTVRKQGKNWATHRIEDASGNLNLGYYSVHVNKLPKKDGVEMSPDQFLSHIRTNLNKFVDTSVSEFEPLNMNNGTTWNSNSPTGAILRIKMRASGITVDHGCVVVSQNSKNEWVFSTIRAGSTLFGP